MIRMQQIYSWCLLMTVALISFATVSPGHAEGALKLNADMACFQGPEGKTYLEVYYSVSQQRLTFATAEEGRMAEALMNLVIFKDDSLWASKAWKIERTAQDSNQVAQREIVDMFRYLIDVPASYRVALYARDLNNKSAIDSVKLEKTFPAFSDEKVEVSDVQLAARIKRMDDAVNDVFEKRNYAVIPNPRQLYGEGLPILFYYFEAYNLSDNIEAERYKRLACLKDMNGNIIQGLGSIGRTRVKSHDLGVEMGSINITKVPSGKYYFVYGVMDTLDNVLEEKQKEVFVYNPNVAAPLVSRETESGLPEDLLAQLRRRGEEGLEQEFEYMVYLTDNKEVEFYESLENRGAKMQFIGELWMKAAREEGMTAAAYRNLYLARVEEAKEEFRGVRSGEGWKTDQGRVFILYGPPSNIERYPSSAGNKPYEIWFYESLRGQGGIEFVFADRFGFRRYELLHSDLRGELQDPNWERFVTAGGTTLDRR